jgi:transposase InsO family protein
METQKMVVGLPKVFPPEGVYKGCVLGKHHQAPFDSGKVWRAQNLLELVHNDVCCINLPSLAGARYILTFIDDLSHFTWVYFLKNKNLVFEKFKEFRAFAEKQCGQPIKCLRSENGGEYVNRPFEEYLVRSGIDWKRLVPHTPQQNGITECKNQMLVEMARCLL